jgi:hypothetical protein
MKAADRLSIPTPVFCLPTFAFPIRNLSSRHALFESFLLLLLRLLHLLFLEQ